jgi:hypothetical protein
MTSFFDKVLRDSDSAARRSARKPWWQTARTARQGFMAAALFGLLGLAALLASFFAWSQLWIGALIWLPLAAVHLASAIALRRRERSA